ncbi:MAG: hypothetical protein GPJ52_02760 [Candidatus Heimdallarchaeota archaeon]|nr:hypothetical protein [Candidatus Heimdallarchaeota archaeon]
MNKTTLVNILKWDGSLVKSGKKYGTLELYRRIGVPQKTIYNIIQIIKLPKPIQKKIGKGDGEIRRTTAVVV